MDKKFVVGQECFGLFTGYGFERINKVKLLETRSNKRCPEYFRYKEIGDRASIGTYDIDPMYLFNTLEEAEAYRDKMAESGMVTRRLETDTPEKMLKYLFQKMYSEYDGYYDMQIHEDVEKRAQELFGIKLK